MAGGIWLRIGVLAAIAAAGAVAWLLFSFNQFTPVRDAFSGRCVPVAGVAGPEDLQIDPTTRRAYISSFDRATRSEPRGSVYAISIDDVLAEDWRDLTGGVPEAFEPLGIYVYRDAEIARLFVVNSAGKTVELYDVGSDGALAHVETFYERRMTSPNDVVAVGPRAFYVTNDLEPGRATILGKLQFLLRSGSGRVLHFDGVSWRIAAEGLRFANGVNVSADGRRLYVAETSASALRIYDRDAKTGTLTLARVVPMGAAVDNINIGEDGALFVAAHPKPLLAADPKATAPSLILRLRDDGGKGRPEEVFADDGSELSGATAAAAFDGTLIIGGLNEKKFLLCELPK